MENLEKNPELKSNVEIELDDIAKEYAEKVRDSLKDQQEKGADTDLFGKSGAAELHMNKIDFNDLTYDDLMIFDKFNKGDLSKEDFDSYGQRLKEYFDKQKEEKGEDFSFFEDSRSNFQAMIRNGLIERTDMKKHPENPIV